MVAAPNVLAIARGRIEADDVDGGDQAGIDAHVAVARDVVLAVWALLHLEGVREHGAFAEIGDAGRGIVVAAADEAALARGHVDAHDDADVQGDLVLGPDGLVVLPDHDRDQLVARSFGKSALKAAEVVGFRAWPLANLHLQEVGDVGFALGKIEVHDVDVAAAVDWQLGRMVDVLAQRAGEVVAVALLLGVLDRRHDLDVDLRRHLLAAGVEHGQVFVAAVGVGELVVGREVLVEQHMQLLVALYGAAEGAGLAGEVLW